MNFEDVSENFSVAKVLSILIVFTGHFFSEIPLWVPTTVALFVFGFSSGFFTAAKYSENFSIYIFWRRKIDRLAYHLFVINLFLLVFLMATGEKGLFSWHTVVSLFGLTGFLNWFKIPNKSPLGLGLWFFTLLLIFYAVYPVLSFLNRSKVRACIFILFSIAIFTTLHFTIRMGHMLWMTAIAFILGPFLCGYRLRVRPKVASGIAISSVMIMLGINFWFKIKFLNYFLILLTSLGVVMFLLVNRLPRALNGVLIFSGCVLEIYFISPYLSVRVGVFPTSVSYLLCLFLTLGSALTLKYFADKLRELIRFYALRKSER